MSEPRLRAAGSSELRVDGDGAQALRPPIDMKVLEALKAIKT